MKKILAIVLAVAMVASIAGIAFAQVAETGNGAPSGAHYNLNIIGVPNEKVDFDGGNGARIFVSRNGPTTFYVNGGTSYEVLDRNGTDGEVGWSRTQPGIIFPYDATATPTWRVQIWVRLEGPQGSSVQWTSAYFDGTEYVLYDQFTLTKDKSTKFTEKTGQLLADQYQDMLWTLDQKTNFRICQMRIYLLDGK
jgi:hypothetical protein